MTELNVYGFEPSIIGYQEILDNLSDQIMFKIVIISIFFLIYALWNILFLRPGGFAHKISFEKKMFITDVLDYLCLVTACYFIVLKILYG